MTLTQLSVEQSKSFAGVLSHKDLATLAQVIRGMEANAHTARAHTKTRGEVRGGGKKPWKQKGTGRARASSTRSPLWRGGGITFGPRSDRNHTLAMTQSMRLKSLRLALHIQAENNAMWTIDQLPTDGKTKSFVSLIPTELTGKRILVLLPEPMTAVTQSARNVPRAAIRLANQVAARDILLADAIVGTEQSFKALSARVTGATA